MTDYSWQISNLEREVRSLRDSQTAQDRTLTNIILGLMIAVFVLANMTIIGVVTMKARIATLEAQVQAISTQIQK